MDPVAFKIFEIEFRWYGILMASGMLIASMLLIRWAEKEGYNRDTIYDFLLWVIPSAIVGARLYYVIFEFESYNGNILRMINFREGGMAIHGGVIAGAIAAYLFCYKRGIKFLKMADMVAPGLILAQAIGRWGNYINGEAHGGPTDVFWAITVNGQKVHPTFLYESIWNLFVFFVLIRIMKNKKFDGQIFFLYGILYSFARFLIEGLRTDSLMFFGLRIAQIMSIFIIIVFSILYYLNKKKIKK